MRYRKSMIRPTLTTRDISAPARHKPRRRLWWEGPLLVLGCLLLAGDLAPSAAPAQRPAPAALLGQTACRLPVGVPLPAGAFFDRAQAISVEAVPHKVYCAYILPLKPHDLYDWYQARLSDLAWTTFYDRYEGDVLEAISAAHLLAIQILQVYGGSELRLIFPPSTSAGAFCQMPADVPAPAGMQVFAVQGLAGGLNCILVSSGDLLSTASFYQRELPKQHWHLAASNDPTQSSAAILAFTKDSRRAYLYLFTWMGLDGPVLLVELSILCSMRTCQGF